MSNTSDDLNEVSNIFENYYPKEYLDAVTPDLVDSSNINYSARISAQELHKYVVGLVGIFMLFLITYPIAMARVSQKEKFAPYQSHLKSLTPEYHPIELK